MMFDGVDPNDRTPQQQPPVRRLLLPLCPAVPPGLFSFLSPNNRLMPVFTFFFLFFLFLLIWRHPVGAVPSGLASPACNERRESVADSSGDGRRIRFFFPPSASSSSSSSLPFLFLFSSQFLIIRIMWKRRNGHLNSTINLE
jgi:hypothetical protein